MRQGFARLLRIVPLAGLFVTGGCAITGREIIDASVAGFFTAAGQLVFGQVVAAVVGSA